MEASAHPRRSHPSDALFGEWLAPDGWRHRRMDWAPPAGIPARGRLLFAGGRGDFIEKYLEAYHHWHERGWQVTAFDWRGQGQSRGDILGGHLSDFGVLVEDLAAILAELRVAGPGPLVAVAHSMGGHVLLRTLVEKRPELDAAVLVAPMVLVNSGVLPRWVAATLAGVLTRIGWDRRPLWKTGPAAQPGSPRQAMLTSCADRYADELWWREREEGFDLGAPSWGWIEAAYRSAGDWFTAARLREISVPVLLLGTRRDRLVSPAAVRRAAAMIPQARLHLYPDAGHEILREANPVRTDALARIDSFLAEHAA